MARYREAVCTHYMAYGMCEKGRDAQHSGYCQRCNKYDPRIRIKYINRKKEKLEIVRCNARY